MYDHHDLMWFAVSGVVLFVAVKVFLKAPKTGGGGGGSFLESAPDDSRKNLPVPINQQNCEAMSQRLFSPASLAINTYMDECYYTAHPNTVGDTIGRPGYPLASTFAAYRASDCQPRYF